MGQCCSTERGAYQPGPQDGQPDRPQASPFAAPKVQQLTTSKDKAKHREVTWKSTGIIGLRDSNLKALPASIEQVGSEARVLDAGNNQIKELSSHVAHLTGLQRLVLANNVLKVLQGDIISRLLQLKVLNLDQNQLTHLPEEIGQLQKLEHLSVNQNQLLDLPQALATCTKLRRLHVHGNHLTALLDFLPPELEEVDASKNKIQAIPENVSLLLKLTTLNLDSNHVSTVPPLVLLNCAALHTLSLHNNPITPDVLQDNPAFDAFEQRRRQKYDKIIGGGCMLGNKGLDEGVDRKVA